MEAELKIGRWQNRTSYGCPYCPFDSLREDAALEHVFDAHRFEPQPSPRKGTLFGPAGQLISTAQGHA